VRQHLSKFLKKEYFQNNHKNSLRVTGECRKGKETAVELLSGMFQMVSSTTRIIEEKSKYDHPSIYMGD
jgi:ABC-type antimicrobial peptide transport system ATPase subunit